MSNAVKTSKLIFLIYLFNNLSLFSNELRVGVFRHDIKSGLSQRKEKGNNVNVEYLSSKTSIIRAAPLIGVSVNSQGGTNSLYLGLNWTYKFPEYFFMDLGLGAVIHDGKLKHSTLRRQSLGSRILFREHFGIGVKFFKNSFMIAINHMSNAGIRQPNHGISDIGIQYGYKF